MRIKIELLVPVWNREYIDMFLHYGLPSLLADNNIPYLLENNFDVGITLLTQENEFDYINYNKTVQNILDSCRVQYIKIDDLITDSKLYGFTISFAFFRGIRSFGNDMTNTYFIFCVADYLYSNNLLCSLANKILSGADVVYSSSIRTNKEPMVNEIDKSKLNNIDVISYDPRELVALSLSNLHASYLDKFATNHFCWSSNLQHMYWKVDENTFIGHHYMAHMLCIKPSKKYDYIDGFCDYSFVPSLCIKPKIEYLNDTDQGVIIELQESEHEKSFNQKGRPNVKQLVEMLSSWTTKEHREMSRTTFIYHCKGLNEVTTKTIKNADRYIEAINRHLSKRPVKTYYNHPHWRWGVWGYLFNIDNLRNKNIEPKFPLHKLRLSFEETDPHIPEKHLILTKIIRKKTKALLKYILFGLPGEPRIWHEDYIDYSFFRKNISKHLCNHKNIFLLSNTENIFNRYIEKIRPNILHYPLPIVMGYDEINEFKIRDEDIKLEAGVILIDNYDIKYLNKIIVKTSTISKNIKLYIYVMNTNAYSGLDVFDLWKELSRYHIILLKTEIINLGIKKIEVKGGVVNEKLKIIFSHKRSIINYAKLSYNYLKSFVYNISCILKIIRNVEAYNYISSAIIEINVNDNILNNKPYKKVIDCLKKKTIIEHKSVKALKLERNSDYITEKSNTNYVNFAMQIWGKRYVDVFLSAGLPSQLTIGNLLSSEFTKNNSVYEIYTTTEDRYIIENSKIFHNLEDNINVIFINIDAQIQENKWPIVRYCHKAAVKSADNRDAALFFLCPDQIWAENSFSNAISMIKDGYHAVLCPGPRAIEEDFIPIVREQFLSKDHCSMPIPSRSLVKLGLENLHQEMKEWFWDNKNYCNCPTYIFFDVEDEGIVAMCYILHPVVIYPEYKNAKFSHIFDQDYLYNACPDINKIYIVQDSDVVFHFEVTPRNADIPPSPKPDEDKHKAMIWYGEWQYNNQHREFVKLPIRLHHKDIDGTKWEKVEQKAKNIVTTIDESLSLSDDAMLILYPEALHRRILAKYKYSSQNYSTEDRITLRNIENSLTSRSIKHEPRRG